MISFILAAVCTVIIVGIDRFTKYLIAANYSLGESTTFIKGVLNITYVQNRGVAWGMMSGKTFIIILLTAAVMIFCVAAMIKAKNRSKLLFWALQLVIAGGIGNTIDRLFNKGVVVDFLQFDFWRQFPVFNIADCAIVIGGGMLVLYFILDCVNEYRQKKQSPEHPRKAENGDN